MNCLYLDEIIDIKIIDKLRESSDEPPSKALVCSNNELLKIMDLSTGQVYQSGGHTDIILCLDVCNNFFISGSKDNQIRLWKYNPDNLL
jgi:WD40 repeat protein